MKVVPTPLACSPWLFRVLQKRTHQLAAPLRGQEARERRRPKVGSLCFGAPVRAEERTQAPDQTARTSPVGALRSPRSDRPHPGRPLACRGCAAALASWQHAPESGLIGLPRRRRLARAADSGQGPHLDPGRGRPSGSTAAGARARSLWLPPSASRHFAQSSLANQDEDAQCQNSCNLQYCRCNIAPPPREPDQAAFRRVLPACERCGAAPARQRAPRVRPVAAGRPQCTYRRCSRGLIWCLSPLFCAHRSTEAQAADFRALALSSSLAAQGRRRRVGAPLQLSTQPGSAS